MDSKKTEREKLLEVITKLNIELPKKKYITNNELKQIIVNYLDFSKKKNVDFTSALKQKSRLGRTSRETQECRVKEQERRGNA